MHAMSPVFCVYRWGMGVDMKISKSKKCEVVDVFLGLPVRACGKAAQYRFYVLKEKQRRVVIYSFTSEMMGCQ
tara:strand:- start:5146 stop:5364 length:219 start_codon:yes stop_codon:yes gene_type:complete